MPGSIQLSRMSLGASGRLSNRQASAPSSATTRSKLHSFKDSLIRRRYTGESSASSIFIGVPRLLFLLFLIYVSTYTIQFRQPEPDLPNRYPTSTRTSANRPLRQLPRASLRSLREAGEHDHGNVRGKRILLQ